MQDFQNKKWLWLVIEIAISDALDYHCCCFLSFGFICSKYCDAYSFSIWMVFVINCCLITPLGMADCSVFHDYMCIYAAFIIAVKYLPLLNFAPSIQENVCRVSRLNSYIFNSSVFLLLYCKVQNFSNLYAIYYH